MHRAGSVRTARTRRTDRSRREDSSGALRHIPSLDGIRGIAVAAVLLFHGDKLVGGYLGVDAFFVLSGFLISTLLLREVRATGRIDFAAFWVRRAKRLLPALVVVLLGVSAFAVFVANPSELGRIRADALATLGYVANWHSIGAGNGYWSLFQAPSPLEHTWSLAIEEQFYLVWPLVVFAVAAIASRRRSASPGDFTARTILILSGVLGVMSAGWMAMLVEPGVDPSRAYFGTDTRAASILVGAALAALLDLRGPVRSVRAWITLQLLGIVSFVALGVAWASVGGTSTGLYRGGLLLCALGVAAVIAASAHPRPGLLSRLLSTRPLRALGVISYGLYLWHWPIYLVLSKDRIGLSGWSLLGVRIAVSVIVATASFLVVERPIRLGSAPRRRLVLAVPLAASLCVATLLVATTGATTPSRGPDLVFASPSDRVATKQRVAPTVKASSRVIVIGDSVAGLIGETTEYYARELGIEARSATMPGCLVADGVGARAIIHEEVVPLEPGISCVPRWIAGVDQFVPDDIVVIYGSAAGFQDLELGGTWAGPCDRAYREWYVPRLRSVLKKFAASGSVVHIARLPHLTNDWAPSNVDHRIDCVNDMNARVGRGISGVRYLDLAAFVCPRGQCRQDIGAARYRVDGMHYSGEAAHEIATWLARQLDDEPGSGFKESS